MSQIEEYINNCEASHQIKLKQIYAIIKEIVPEAEETLSYSIPTFRLEGNLVHFADNKKHLGFYPSPSGIEKFKSELKDYKYSKGAIQFSYDKELPIELIKKIVEYRVKENRKGI
jgi:uncharacterized protein YdhG (YjbR/CyaY superfamily)